MNLIDKSKENIIVVAHRGAPGGNIPCNTMAAYEIALKQGADMIEADVSCSADGKLFLFHPGMERAHLNKFTSLKTKKFASIQKMNYVNNDKTPTQFRIASFDDFLEQFKGRCYINIDKFWSNPQKIYEAVKLGGDRRAGGVGDDGVDFLAQHGFLCKGQELDGGAGPDDAGDHVAGFGRAAELRHHVAHHLPAAGRRKSLLVLGRSLQQLRAVLEEGGDFGDDAAVGGPGVPVIGVDLVYF